MHSTLSGDTLLSHHFDDVGQQKDSSTLGMWAFLGTEVMFFGGLFAAYAIYRTNYPEAFGAASRHLNVILGAFNTAILLCSSLSMAMAVNAAQLRQRKRVVGFLVATMILGSTFLGIKAYEWYVDYQDGLIPGINWNWEQAEAEHGKHEAGASAKTVAAAPNGDAIGNARDDRNSPRPAAADSNSRETNEPQTPLGEEIASSVPSGRAQLFFLLYFLMTGLHAFHMVVGITLVGIIAIFTGRGWFSGGGETQVEVTGLYWHFIDVVWVFLYPLLYLIDVRGGH